MEAYAIGGLVVVGLQTTIRPGMIECMENSDVVIPWVPRKRSKKE
jgi:hypothetical protein